MFLSRMARTVFPMSVLATVVISVALNLSAAEPAQTAAPESKADRDQRMAWFREARFGMFIHWGVYSVPAGEWKDKKTYGEWFLEETKMPVSQYEKYRDQFNLVKFDAKQWVALAKEAGVKYIVITSKHHDGFAMFDTKLTDWSIMSTPYKHDPIKDLAAACKEAGIKFCLYHSIMDWHHPDYTPRRAWNDVAAKAKATPNFDLYVKFMKGQLKELVDNYGPLGILWFDGEWENSWTHEQGKDLYAYCRSLQSDVIVNNRVGKNRQGMQGLSKGNEIVGDYGTPEQEIPADGLPGVDWESCMTMNNHWGYNKDDQNWKSSASLIRMLIDIASKGGNYLLNVGPTSEGLIPAPSVERLRDMGKWLKQNGESIYGTTASPFKKLAWGRATKKPGKIYLHVFDWPKGELEVPGLKDEVTKAYLLADPNAALTVRRAENAVYVAVPAKAPDAVASVVVLEIADTTGK
jgi:alpha-L-fucosidase